MFYSFPQAERTALIGEMERLSALKKISDDKIIGLNDQLVYSTD
jgi:hypothetical protein